MAWRSGEAYDCLVSHRLVSVSLKEIKSDNEMIKSAKDDMIKSEEVDLSPDFKDKVEEIEGGEAGDNHVIPEITIEVLEYLKVQGKAKRSDFMEEVYPGSKHSEKSEGNWWNCGKKGLHEVSDKSSKVEAPSKGHSTYTWKG